ncbi:hypothetical protein M569_14945 [Genlisea aurea]|uniref:Uncharacterized protein n=1 Tax=Genlisea aurea TaxID=192259 RepID=S8BZA0_9LAMI|nr:hypothetical protein M569_14945 [Genlisea aurea]
MNVDHVKSEYNLTTVELKHWSPHDHQYFQLLLECLFILDDIRKFQFFILRYVTAAATTQKCRYGQMKRRKQKRWRIHDFSLYGTVF